MIAISNEKIVLKVVEAKERDYGSSKARIDIGIMKKLGIGPGDIVEIEGRRKTAAIAWPAYPEDQGKNIVRIDASLMTNARVNVGDEVVVRKADAREAKYVKIAPLAEAPYTDPSFKEYVKRKLIDKPFVEEDIVSIPTVGNHIPFRILYTIPEGIVYVSPNTKVAISTVPLRTLAEEVAKLLEKEKYEILELGEKDDEPDIVAEKKNETLIVKIVKDYVKEAKTLNFYITLGKTLSLMKNPKAKYAIVLTEEHEHLAEKIPEHIRKKLNLKIFTLKRKYTIKKLKN